MFASSYQPAPSGANDPPTIPHQAVETAPEPERPFSVKPHTWADVLATIVQHVDAPNWWDIWRLINRRQPSLMWGGFHELWEYWDAHRKARGLEQLGPWSTAEKPTKEGKRR